MEIFPCEVSATVETGILILPFGGMMIGFITSVLNPLPRIDISLIISVSHPVLLKVMILSLSWQSVVVPKSSVVGDDDRIRVPSVTVAVIGIVSRRDGRLFFDVSTSWPLRFPFTLGIKRMRYLSVSPGAIKVLLQIVVEVKSISPVSEVFSSISVSHPIFVINPNAESCEQIEVRGKVKAFGS